MKKTISILLCTILAAAFLTACAGASDTTDNYYGWNDADYPAPQAAPAPAPASEMMMEDSVVFEAESMGGTAFRAQAGGSGITPINAPVTEGLAEKIIYSVYADVETVKFDETIEKVHRLLERHKAFIENSNISGINYEARLYGWNEFRSAYFSLRVPQEQLNAMTANLDSLGNVTYLSSSADNITAQFFDTQSRLNALEIQEERLLSMLAKADEITDLIALEERLSDVRYQIESITSTLNNWQRQVDYSTLTLNIREVEQFTEQTPIHRTYWEQIGDGFMATIRSIGDFFMALFKWLIVSAPVLVILAVIAVIIFIIIRKVIRKNKTTRPNSPGYYYAPGAPTTTGTPIAPGAPTAPDQTTPENKE